jgi:hypothetical protein
MAAPSASTTTAATPSSSNALFGEDQEDSYTYGRWTVKVTPRLDFALHDGRVITIPQNAKVCRSLSCLK